MKEKGAISEKNMERHEATQLLRSNNNNTHNPKTNPSTNTITPADVVVACTDGSSESRIDGYNLQSHSPLPYASSLQYAYNCEKVASLQTQVSMEGEKHSNSGGTAAMQNRQHLVHIISSDDEFLSNDKFGSDLSGFPGFASNCATLYGDTQSSSKESFKLHSQFSAVSHDGDGDVDDTYIGLPGHQYQQRHQQDEEQRQQQRSSLNSIRGSAVIEADVEPQLTTPAKKKKKSSHSGSNEFTNTPNFHTPPDQIVEVNSNSTTNSQKQKRVQRNNKLQFNLNLQQKPIANCNNNTNNHNRCSTESTSEFPVSSPSNPLVADGRKFPQRPALRKNTLPADAFERHLAMITAQRPQMTLDEKMQSWECVDNNNELSDVEDVCSFDERFQQHEDELKEKQIKINNQNEVVDFLMQQDVAITTTTAPKNYNFTQFRKKIMQNLSQHHEYNIEEYRNLKKGKDNYQHYHHHHQHRPTTSAEAAAYLISQRRFKEAAVAAAIATENDGMGIGIKKRCHQKVTKKVYKNTNSTTPPPATSSSENEMGKYPAGCKRKFASKQQQQQLNQSKILVYDKVLCPSSSEETSQDVAAVIASHNLRSSNIARKAGGAVTVEEASSNATITKSTEQPTTSAITKTGAAADINSIFRLHRLSREIDKSNNNSATPTTMPTGLIQMRLDFNKKDSNDKEVVSEKKKNELFKTPYVPTAPLPPTNKYPQTATNVASNQTNEIMITTSVANNQKLSSLCSIIDSIKSPTHCSPSSPLTRRNENDDVGYAAGDTLNSTKSPDDSASAATASMAFHQQHEFCNYLGLTGMSTANAVANAVAELAKCNLARRSLRVRRLQQQEKKKKDKKKKAPKVVADMSPSSTGKQLAALKMKQLHELKLRQKGGFGDITLWDKATPQIACKESGDKSPRNTTIIEQQIKNKHLIKSPIEIEKNKGESQIRILCHISSTDDEHVDKKCKKYVKQIVAPIRQSLLRHLKSPPRQQQQQQQQQDCNTNKSFNSSNNTSTCPRSSQSEIDDNDDNNRNDKDNMDDVIDNRNKTADVESSHPKLMQNGGEEDEYVIEYVISTENIKREHENGDAKSLHSSVSKNSARNKTKYTEKVLSNINYTREQNLNMQMSTEKLIPTTPVTDKKSPTPLTPLAISSVQKQTLPQQPLPQPEMLHEKFQKYLEQSRQTKPSIFIVQAIKSDNLIAIDERKTKSNDELETTTNIMEMTPLIKETNKTNSKMSVQPKNIVGKEQPKQLNKIEKLPELTVLPATSNHKLSKRLSMHDLGRGRGRGRRADRLHKLLTRSTLNLTQQRQLRNRKIVLVKTIKRAATASSSSVSAKSNLRQNHQQQQHLSNNDQQNKKTLTTTAMPSVLQPQPQSQLQPQKTNLNEKHETQIVYKTVNKSSYDRNNDNVANIKNVVETKVQLKSPYDAGSFFMPIKDPTATRRASNNKQRNMSNKIQQEQQQQQQRTLTPIVYKPNIDIYGDKHQPSSLKATDLSLKSKQMQININSLNDDGTELTTRATISRTTTTKSLSSPAPLPPQEQALSSAQPSPSFTIPSNMPSSVSMTQKTLENSNIEKDDSVVVSSTTNSYDETTLLLQQNKIQTVPNNNNHINNNNNNNNNNNSGNTDAIVISNSLNVSNDHITKNAASSSLNHTISYTIFTKDTSTQSHVTGDSIHYLSKPKANLTNPLKKSNGSVLYIYYELDVLIVVQENLISFWKYYKMMNILSMPIGRFATHRQQTQQTQQHMKNLLESKNSSDTADSITDSEWLHLGECKRMSYDSEIQMPYGNRICVHNSIPIYIEMRCLEVPRGRRDCNLLSMYVNVYYYNDEEMHAKMHSIQLDAVQSAPTSVVFTTITESRYFVMAWPQENILGKIRSGLCKYSLTPHLDTLASIREFKNIRHEIRYLECTDDDKLLGFGETQLTIWDHRSGDVLMNYDLNIKLGRNLGSIYYPSLEIGQNSMILIFQYIQNQIFETQAEIVVIACNISHATPAHRIIQRHRLPTPAFDQIIETTNTGEHLIIKAAQSDAEIWISCADPNMTTFVPAQNTERFYMRGRSQLIEMTPKTLTVDTFANYALRLATGIK